MERIYHKYDLWEDHKNGMYNDNDILDKDVMVSKSIELLKSPEKFYFVMQNILKDWKFAVENNLSNRSQNRRAWLGAAACLYNHKCPEYLTRIAWSLLNNDVKKMANNIADKIILEYEAKNKKVRSGMGTEMLF